MDIKEVQAKYPIGLRIDLTADCKTTLSSLWFAADSINFLHKKSTEEVTPILDELGEDQKSRSEVIENFLITQSLEHPFKSLVSLRMGGFGSNVPINLHDHNKSMIERLCWLLAFRSLCSKGFDMDIQEYMVLTMSFDRENFQVIITGYQFDVEEINRNNPVSSAPDDKDINDFLKSLPPIEGGEDDE